MNIVEAAVNFSFASNSMKTVYLGIMLAFNAVLLSSADDISAAQKRPSSVSLKTQYIEASIEVNHDSSPSHCRIAISIQNVGSESLMIFNRLDGLYDAKLSIYNTMGEKCKPTDKGKQALESDALESISSGSSILKVIPRGSKFDFVIQLEELFYLHPGKWSLDCELRIRGSE